MTPADARRLVASHLAGRRVSGTDLAAARQVLAASGTDLSPLRAELGLASGVSVCEQFSAHVAEFCEMSSQLRQEEAPELVRHVAECDACRDLFWRIKPRWTNLVDKSTAVGAALVRVLAERIRLVVSVGELLDAGLGPPALARVTVAATAGAGPGAAREDTIREWNLTDDDGQQAVHLRVEQMSAHDALVSVWLQQGGGRLEVRRQDGSVLLSGPLEDIQVEPLRLGPGVWALRVLLDGSPSRAWEIPLELVTDTGKGASDRE